MPKQQVGALYLVGTPIGNLEDMTQRALNTLKKVDVIACEDTRRAQKLLSHFGISGKRLLSHHQANEYKSAPGLIKLIQEGQTMAYVSDGGMPTVSDPGFILSQAALEAGIEVHTIPGVTAVTTALTGAGLATARFTFLGFMPRKQGEIARLLERFADTPEALVIYESPQRIGKTLTTTMEVLGDRKACICRELTKLHEEFNRKPLSELKEQYTAKDATKKGEFTLIIEGKIL